MRFPERNLFRQGSKLIFAIVLSIALSSCFLLDFPIRQGSLFINVTSDNLSRELRPPIDDVTVAAYRISGTGPNGQVLEPIVSASMPLILHNLVIGEWAITVDGLNASENPVILASATQTLWIHADKETETTFALTLLEGEGSLSLSVKWLSALSIDEIRGTWISADGLRTGAFTWSVPADITLTDSYYKISNTIAGLRPGEYSLMFSCFFGGYRTGPSLTESSVIFADIATQGLLEIPAIFSSPLKPAFSISPGTYEDARTVVITSSTADAEIFYTTDGTDPNLLSKKYSSPLYISTNLTLKAISISSTKLMSAIASGEYRILSNTTQSVGARILRYGSKLYVIGGMDSGSHLSTVRSANVAIDGSAGSLASDSSLPEGLAYGSVMGAGNYLYYLGGESDNGLSSTIYYARIYATGNVGFGPSRVWNPNATPLPEPRTKAAAILQDGWIYLIGGDTPSGTSDTIIRARIYPDGQVGKWYPVEEKMPKKLRDTAAAILDDRLYIAGGISGSEAVSDCYSYAIGSYGWLSDMRIEDSLPELLSNLVLASKGDDLIAAGGFRADGASDAVYRRNTLGGWAHEENLAVDADGPSSGRAAGALWYLPKDFLNQADAAVSLPANLVGLSLAAEAPEAVPGSGLVQSGIPIMIIPEPGVTIKYSKNGGAETTAVPTITAPTTLTIRAYVNGVASSPQLRREYRVKTGSFTTFASGEITVRSNSTELETIALQERGVATSSVLLSVRVETSGHYRLIWADNDTEAAFAPILLSLLESDVSNFTEVPDRTGLPIAGFADSSASPLHLYLQAGTYYLLAEHAQGSLGGKFGLNISRE